MKFFTKQLAHEGATLTAYLHDISLELGNADVRPAVLVCPGGGYLLCSDREAEPIALAYLAEGYQAFVLRYSVGQDVPFEDSFADAKEALAYLKDNAEALHLDPERIAAVGFSAGGHLAAALGVLAEDRPAALILGYPVITREFARSVGKPMPEISAHVTKDCPPTFIFSTSNDESVPIRSSLEMACALAAQRVQFQLHIFYDGSHGLSLAKPLTSGGDTKMVSESVAAWFDESVAWLKGIWGDFPLTGANLGLGMNEDAMDLDTQVKVLVRDEACRAILEAFIPGVGDMLEQNPSSGEYSLNVMHQFSPQIVTDEIIAGIGEALAQRKKED